MDRSATRTVAAVPPRTGNNDGPSVAAVIVTHDAPAGLDQRIAVVLEQVQRVYVVDNGSSVAYQEAMRHLASKPDVQVLELPENRGLAAALNIGVALAHRDGFGWVLLLDHDSTPGPQMVARMLSARDRWTNKRRIAALAPEIDYADTGIRFGWSPRARARKLRLKLSMPAQMHGPEAVLNAIGSGLLVDVGHYGKLGGMREEWFIDGVDTEFCLRACAAGYDIVGVPGALLHHHLGHIEKQQLFGTKDVWPTHHAPLRHYYIARNRVHLAREHLGRYPGWFMFETRLALINAMNMALYEHDRGAKFWMMLRGTLAGIAGRTGPHA